MSTLNVDNVLPQSANIVNVNGVNIEGANNTVYLGSLSNIPASSNSVIIGTGSALALTGQSNVVIGRFAMLNATTAQTGVAVGSGAGQSLTTGNANTFVGSSSGVNVTTGFSNTCIGQGAGSSLDANSNGNTFIGNGTGTNTVGPITGTGNICIGLGASPSTASVIQEITLGGPSIGALRCAQTTITSLSDARDKKEIEELPVGLDFVKGLKPVKFVWDDRDENGRHEVKDFGFIAQDLKKSQEDANLADTLKLVYEENPEKLEASYGKLIPVLVKAIQELTAKVEALEAK
jgi:hypothetical protein